MDFQTELGQILSTVVYFVVGFILFGASIFVMEKLAPFSIRKEIEQDHNVALAVLMGSVLIGLAVILGAVIRS